LRFLIGNNWRISAVLTQKHMSRRDISLGFDAHPVLEWQRLGFLVGPLAVRIQQNAVAIL
jgi:hypothetical protein